MPSRVYDPIQRGRIYPGVSSARIKADTELSSTEKSGVGFTNLRSLVGHALMCCCWQEGVARYRETATRSTAVE